MKRLIHFILVLILLFMCRAGQAQVAPPPASAVQEVEATLRAFFDAIESYDYQRLQALTADDYTLIENGPVWTVDSLMARMKQLEGQATLSYALSDVETTVEEPMAWMTYENHGVIQVGDREQVFDWTESVVFRREAEGWKMVLLHSTMNEPTPNETAQAQADNPLVGGWELVYGKYGLPDDPVEVERSNAPTQLKVFSDGHYAHVMHNVDGSFLAASAGSYVIEGDRYIETTNWSSTPENVGTKTTFRFRIEGDSLFMSGPIAIVDSSGKKLDDFQRMEEVRRRAQ